MGYSAVFAIIIIIIVCSIMEIKSKIEERQYQKYIEDRNKQEQNNKLVAQMKNTIAEMNLNMISVNGIMMECSKIPYGLYRVTDKFGNVQQVCIHINGPINSRFLRETNATNGWILRTINECPNMISVNGIMTNISEIPHGRYQILDVQGNIKNCLFHLDGSFMSENILKNVVTNGHVLILLSLQ